MRDNQAAIHAVQQAMSGLGLSAEGLANRAELSPNTVRNFLEGRTWPRMANLGAMEAVLGWPAGRIEDLALGVAGDLTTAGGAQPPAWKPMEVSYGGVTVTVRVEEDLTDEEAADVLRDVFQVTMRRVARARQERGQ